MQKLNLEKLTRLRGDLAQARATMRGLSDAAHAARDAAQQNLLAFDMGLSNEIRKHYRPGDDLADLLRLPGHHQTYLRAEIDRAAAILDLRRQHRDLLQRCDALRPTVDALTRLVERLDRFAEQHEFAARVAAAAARPVDADANTTETAQ